VNAPYEMPTGPAVTLDTAGQSADLCVETLFAAVIERVAPTSRTAQ